MLGTTTIVTLEPLFKMSMCQGAGVLPSPGDQRVNCSSASSSLCTGAQGKYYKAGCLGEAIMEESVFGQVGLHAPT